MGNPKTPQDGKLPNLGNFPGIPIWEIPGREKLEAVREGGNRNFPLNIPAEKPLGQQQGVGLITPLQHLGATPWTSL